MGSCAWTCDTREDEHQIVMLDFDVSLVPCSSLTQSIVYNISIQTPNGFSMANEVAHGDKTNVYMKCKLLVEQVAIYRIWF